MRKKPPQGCRFIASLQMVEGIHTLDRSGSLAKQKTIEAPKAILTLGKHGLRTAEMLSASQLKRRAG